MDNLLSACISIFIVSLISFIGAVTMVIRAGDIQKFMHYFISFAVGTLLGNVFLHLIPESIEHLSINHVGIFILIGMGGSFFFEQLFHSYHNENNRSHKGIKPVAIINLLTDGLHNFIDGAVITFTFLISPELGVSTSIAIALHEIPQELSDLSILIHGGFSRMQALLWNFISSLGAFLGFFIIWLLHIYAHNVLLPYLTPIAAGGFLYIAAADLIPTLHAQTDYTRVLAQLVSFIAGIILMLLI